MRRAFALSILTASALLSAASARVAPVAEPADFELSRARAEADLAARKLSILEERAERAGDEAARLRAKRLAAAASIEEAEARVSASDALLRIARARAAVAERRLAQRRAPLASLLAAVATMGRQPPLLTVADRGSIEELVRVRALLDSTMPVIERRSAALAAELAQRRQLASATDRARADLTRDRDRLTDRQRQFAELELQASRRAASMASQAFGAGDRVLVSGEALESAGAAASDRRAAMTAAAQLARLEFAQPRPMKGDSGFRPSELAYSLPSTAPLLDGLGSVSRSGIASRGLQLDARRGTRLIVPADGVIAFAAPFRGQDGVIIIDHGNGWTSLILGAASDRPRGTRVRRGEPLGLALGIVGVELRRNGAPVSPALIAASSVPLSNSGNSR